MERGYYFSLLSVVATAATYLGMHFVVEPRLPVNAVEVPPIAGLSPEQARGLLEPRGLLLVLDAEKVDERVAPGTLCEQSPLGGSRLKRGDLVHASLARAGGPHLVPKVIGLTVDAARDAISEAKLHVGRTVDGPSDTVPRGQVAASSPEAGSEVKVETSIDLTLSTGPSTQPVPSVVGKRVSTAKQLLEKAGFAVGATKYGSNDDYDQGVVIGQNPPAGSQASPGVKIDLVVNDCDSHAALDECVGRPDVGAKAERLARAAAAGLPVLDGVVLLPGEVVDDALLGAALSRLGGERFIVRSSSALEDAPGASAAGVFESVPGARGLDEVKAAIAQVRASAEGEPARVYLTARGVTPAPLAVLIQPMAQPLKLAAWP